MWRFLSIFFLLVLFVFYRCDSEKFRGVNEFNQSNKKEMEQLDKIKNVGSQQIVQNLFTKIKTDLPEFVIEYHNREIERKILEKNELVFRDDSDFNIREIQHYQAELGWMAYIIKGEFKPSDSEYDFYGLYKNEVVFKHGFLSQPVEIVTQLEFYELTDGVIKVYGKQWDLSGIDDGSKPPNKPELLLIAP
jgi:hypothetical protein